MTIDIKKIDKVACIGAGTIGSSWATYFVSKGLKVNVQDVNYDVLNAAKIRIDKNLQHLFKNDVISEEQLINSKELISYNTGIRETMSEVKFIQESTLEDYEIKESVIKEIDKHFVEDTIIASSSSGLLVSKLQEFSKHPGNIIIAHPFNPPHLIPLVEIVGGNASKEIISGAIDFYKSIDKVPILLNKEVPGHVANRIQAAIWRECIDLVDKGVCSVADVDAAVSYGPGLRWALMGPNMIFHLGGGEKGIEGFLNQLKTPFESWWHDMASWECFPDNISETLSKGIANEMGGSSFEEKVKWRDEKLIAVLKELDLI